MKKVSLAVCVLFFFSVVAAWGDEGLKKVSDGIYSYTNVTFASPDNRFGANAGIVVGENGVLVVDTLTSAREAKKFLADIRKVTQKPIQYVVNTHYHLDHAFGNCVFADMGVAVISHSACRSKVEQVKDEALEVAKSFGMDDAALEGTRVVVPNIAFDRKLTLDLGNREVHLLHYGRHSHTTGSLVVWVPGQKVAFAGDILFTDFHPYMAEGDLDGWFKTLDDIAALGAEKIIPGHGPLSGVKDLKEMKAYLADFDRNAKKLCATSSDLEHIQAEMIKVLPKRAQAQVLVGANLQGRYMKPANKKK